MKPRIHKSWFICSLLWSVFCWLNLRRCPNGLRMQEDSCMLSWKNFQIFNIKSMRFHSWWKQNRSQNLYNKSNLYQPVIASNLVSCESPYHHVPLLGGVVRRSKFGRSRPRWGRWIAVKLKGFFEPWKKGVAQTGLFRVCPPWKFNRALPLQNKGHPKRKMSPSKKTCFRGFSC